MGKRSSVAISNEIFRETQQALTAKQMRFVEAFVSNGGFATEAAIEAGYPETSARNAGHRNIRLAHVQLEIQKQLVKAMGTSAVQAFGVVTKLMHSARSDYVRLEAAKDVLDRAGFRPPDRVNHSIDAGLSVVLNLGGEEGGVKTVEHVPVTLPSV